MSICGFKDLKELDRVREFTTHRARSFRTGSELRACRGDVRVDRQQAEDGGHRSARVVPAAAKDVSGCVSRLRTRKLPARSRKIVFDGN
jgi:hypothetical protein